MSMLPTLRRIPRPSTPRNHQIHSSPNQHSRTIPLPDGRVLGYVEYGNPNGRPLLYFHGYPSSRVEAEPLDPIARRCGFRLLALDRPGFGLSTPQPGRKISDWPNDVRAFAKSTGLESFAVVGISGGGPFALACAHELPQSMIAAVGLFASGPPWVAGQHHMSLIRQMASILAVYWPSGLHILLSLCLYGLRALATAGPIVRRIDAWLETQASQKKEKDEREGTAQNDSDSTNKQTKTTKERREYLLDLLINEPFAQGVDATVLEADLLSSQDWGFKFEDVRFDPVRIWHGAKDANSPIVMMRYLAQRLPHGVLHEYENDTHYTMFPHFEEALAQLAKDFDNHKK